MTEEAMNIERLAYIARCRLDERDPKRAEQIRAGQCVDVERRLFGRVIG